jgi:hypothetical protein
MASNEGNVAALEVDGNNHDNVETVTTTTAAPATTTTMTVVPETTTENIPAPSSSIEPAAETSTTPPKDAQVEATVESETPKEKKDTEELPTSQAATATATATTSAAESTAEDVATVTVVPTPTQPTTTSIDGPRTEGRETVNITEEGESSDQTQPAKEPAEESGPELVITLLLTTGARHPFKIDRKYLKRRSVKVENDDPFNMSVYTLKELIWREWRSGMLQFNSQRV